MVIFIIIRLVQSIKTDIRKPLDKSITIDHSNSNFIDQSIEFDTHNYRCSFKVLNLLILSFLLRTVYCKYKVPVLPRQPV